MQARAQKSFQDILEEHLGDESEVASQKESPTFCAQNNDFLFSPLEVLHNFALKNIKTRFLNTAYKVHVGNLEVKRAEARQLRFKVLCSEINNTEVQEAFKFFFDRGASGILDLSLSSLKKDFRMLAMKLHPDRQQQQVFSMEDANAFHMLKKSYDILYSYIKSDFPTKKAA